MTARHGARVKALGLRQLEDAGTRAYWALVLLLVAVFLLGGSARGDAAPLIVLRPVAAVLLGFGLWQVRAGQMKRHKLLLVLALAIAALPALQLVPLPFAVWSGLPGRAQVVDIDAIAGLGQIARPLSLAPDATLNALWSLLVPAAALCVGIQLDRQRRERLLPAMLGLIGASALFGLLQLLQGGDSPLYFYDITNVNSAVGLFANRNHQAVLLAMALPMLALWATPDRRPGMIRLLGGSVALLSLIPMILITGSRAGAIAGLAALLSVILIARFGSGSEPASASPRRRRVHLAGIAGAAAAVTALIGLTVAFGRAEAWERLQQVFHEDDLRFRILPTLAQMFPKYWPFGTGLGAFEKIFQADEPDALLGPVYMNHAHNDWLEAALTGGVPAIVLLLAAGMLTLCSVYRHFVRRSGRAAPDRFARLGLIVIVLAGLASISDYPLRTPLFQVVFVIAALWASCSLPHNETLEASIENRVDVGGNESNKHNHAAA